MNQTQFIAPDVTAMHTCGQSIAIQLEIPSVIYLVGDMGSGKTTLVQGITKYFEYDGVVTSPTYNLIHEYPCNNVDIAHLDLYRLESPQDILMLGLADLITHKSLLLIEWPELGEGFIPRADLIVNIGFLELKNTDSIGRKIDILFQ